MTGGRRVPAVSILRAPFLKIKKKYSFEIWLRGVQVKVAVCCYAQTLCNVHLGTKSDTRFVTKLNSRAVQEDVCARGPK